MTTIIVTIIAVTIIAMIVRQVWWAGFAAGIRAEQLWPEEWKQIERENFRRR